MSEPVAAFISDVHLMHTPPPARVKEPDWYAAMARTLRQVRILIGGCPDCGGSGHTFPERLGDGTLKPRGPCLECDGEYHREVPLFIAGDLFHYWRSVPQLINWAMEVLPTALAIPGQHDLPYHNYEDRHKSAYWTLYQSGRIADIRASMPYRIDARKKGGAPYYIWGFPWGHPITPPITSGPGIHIALVHAYVWANRATSYPGAAEAAKVGAYAEQLKGYHAAFFGDNHKWFEAKAGDCHVINCGSLMRLNSDQEDHTPSVWLLFDDGAIKQIPLETRNEIFEKVEREQAVQLGQEMHDFVQELNKLGDMDLDYPTALRQALREGVSAGAAKVLAQVLDGK